MRLEDIVNSALINLERSWLAGWLAEPVEAHAAVETVITPTISDLVLGSNLNVNCAELTGIPDAVCFKQPSCHSLALAPDSIPSSVSLP